MQMFSEALRVMGLSQATTGELTALVLGIIVVSALFGWLTDAVMGQAGFGPLGNGLLVVVSAVAGIVGVSWGYRHVLQRFVTSSDMIVIVCGAAAFTVFVLMGLAAIKRLAARG